MARKTWAEAQITRQRILEAASTVFLEQGFEGSSLQRVADAAGLTRGAIYWHFANKKQLLHALMARTPSCEHAKNSKVMDDDPAQTLTRLALAPLERLIERLQRSAPLSQALGMPNQAERSVDAVVMGHRMYGEQRALLLVELQLACDKVCRQRDLGLGPSSRGAALGLTWLIEGLMWRWIKDPEAFDLLGTGGLAVAAYVQGMCSCGVSQGLPAPTPGHTAPQSRPSGAAVAEPEHTPPPPPLS